MRRLLKITIIVFLSTGFIAMVQYCTKPSVPTVTTASVSDIKTTSAVSGGNVTNNGGEEVTERGVCWSITQNPTTSSSKLSNGTGNGPFTCSLTQLTSSTQYHIRAYAINSVGIAYGDDLTFTTKAVVSTVPGAPTIGTATAGNAQSTITFTAPGSNGGSAITGYTATSNPGGITGTSTASPVTVTGLTNGTAYTFTVTATNAIGTGPASSASNSVTPAPAATVPGAPTIGTATAGNAQATVTFTAPANNGGSAITSYTITSNPGGLTGAGTASPITVTGLTNGTAYTFTVTATNAIGTGPASSASNSVTPAPAATGPGAPTIGTATKGNAQATITFTAPVSNGGSAITGYTVTSNPGGLTATGIASPITVTGLTNGTAYTFTVTATNAIGTGPASAASNSVTPSTVPGAPAIGTATKGNAQATVTFTAPGSNGGSAITGYTVTSNPGGFTATGSASPVTVTGLINGTAYTFTVTATNANGAGLASVASNSVIPSTVPGPPTGISAIAGCFKATVKFSAPGSNGGSAITGYTITSNPGGFIATGSASPVTVIHLPNNIAYTFTVVAINSNGNSIASAPSNSAIPTAPSSVADRDGNLYNTVSIGYQVWMRENLKTTHYKTGEDIPLITDATQWQNQTTPGYCWYSNNYATYGVIYGALYNWYAVNTGNLCPIGWHVASSAEWDELVLTLDPDAQLKMIEQSTLSGGKLKETGTTHWTSPNPATNESGFTALPGGTRNNANVGYIGFSSINTFGYWHTSTEYSNSTVGSRNIRYVNSSIYKDNENYPKFIGQSVRCIMDN